MEVTHFFGTDYQQENFSEFFLFIQNDAIAKKTTTARKKAPHRGKNQVLEGFNAFFQIFSSFRISVK